MPFIDFFPKVSQAPSKCFFKWIDWIKWIKSRIPRWIWKILFVLSSYEFLAMLEGKIGEGPFYRVQSDELIVWPAMQKKLLLYKFLSSLQVSNMPPWMRCLTIIQRHWPLVTRMELSSTWHHFNPYCHFIQIWVWYL